MSTRPSVFLRQNILGLVAIFIALGGTAAALDGKNTVDSGDIKNGQVKTKDLQAGAVNGAIVADNTITGDDVDEATLKGLATAGAQGAPGPAGATGAQLLGGAVGLIAGAMLFFANDRLRDPA